MCAVRFFYFVISFVSFDEPEVIPLTILNLFSLLGGLALFLHGMQMMSTGLEAAAGNRMKRILQRLTATPLLGVVVGAGITAAIQSSSATTVMVVGFVNSGMMTLRQAVWIIMGANVGTTVTSLLIALDIGALAPLLAFIGVALVVFVKRVKIQHYGQIIAGLGILFLGMEMMSAAMVPLRDSPAFIGLMTRFSNPAAGILVGMLFTALIQSSSASVGILQTLASGGLIGLQSASFVLFGQNIGTCITALLASVGTSRSAKRATLIHLMFNIIGALLFTALCVFFPLTGLIQQLLPNTADGQIAAMHMLFNLTTTALLLPFGNKLADLATRLLPDVEEDVKDAFHLEFLKAPDLNQERMIGVSAIAVNDIQLELNRMLAMTADNVERSFRSVLEYGDEQFDQIAQQEDYIDYLNKEIAGYISRVIPLETNEQSSRRISGYLKLSGDIERIGDHAMNLAEYARSLKQRGGTFSADAQGEIDQMRQVCLDALALVRPLRTIGQEQFAKVAAAEQHIDDLTDGYRHSQFARLRSGTCADETSILYSELLTDFERIGDHVLNIGEVLAGRKN